MQGSTVSELAISAVIQNFPHLIQDWMDCELKTKYGSKWDQHKSEGVGLAVKEISAFTGKSEKTIYRWFNELKEKGKKEKKHSGINDYYDKIKQQNALTGNPQTEIEFHKQKQQRAKQEYDSEDSIINALYESIHFIGKR